MLEGKEGKRIQIEEVIEASNMSAAWMKVKANHDLSSKSWTFFGS